MSLALRSATSTTCFDLLLLSTTRGVQIQVLAAKAEESSRFAKYSADSLVRFVWRNVPWIVSCTICVLSHKLFSRGADASRGGTRDVRGGRERERVPWSHAKPPLVHYR